MNRKPRLFFGLAGQRRKRRRIEVSARPIGPDRSWSKSKMVFVDVIFAAREFVDFLVRLASHPSSRVGERLGIKLRILDQSLHVDVVRVGPRPTLDHMQGITMWAPVLIRPNLVSLESDRVDHQSISVPTSNFLAEKRRVRILRMLSASDRNEAIVAIGVEKRDPV
jgi:hypothetical protein